MAFTLNPNSEFSQFSSGLQLHFFSISLLFKANATTKIVSPELVKM
jgi:hypothetical protein